eukprot:18863-Pelagomonas_calceolata.AAC.1
MQIPWQPVKLAHVLFKRLDVANLLFVVCGSTPSTALHAPHNLCLKSSVKSCSEVGVPCFIAVTKDSQRRNLESHPGSEQSNMRGPWSASANMPSFTFYIFKERTGSHTVGLIGLVL